MKKYTITLQDIRENENLNQAGAMPGDEIINNELSRVFSSTDDAFDKGYKITQQDIDENQNLQEGNAEVGDRIVNNELKRTYKDDAYKQFVYGYDEGDSDIDNAADYLERKFPLGRFSVDFDNGIQYYSPEKLYGKGFMEADDDTRRTMILRAKERGLKEAYGDYFEPDPDSYSRIAGNVGAAVASPTTAIAPGKSLLQMSGRSAAIGGSYSVLEDMAKTGEIDLEKAAIYSAGAGLAGAGFYGIGKGIGKIKDKSAEKIIKEAELIIAKDVEKGFSVNEAMTNLVGKVDNTKLTKAIKRTGINLKVPPTESAAAKITRDTVVNDSAVGRTKSSAIEDLLGSLSTGIRNISEGVGGLVRRFEFDLHVNTANAMTKANPFLSDLNKLSGNLKAPITRNLYNGNLVEAERLMPEAMKVKFQEVKNILNQTYDDSQKAGIFFDKLDDYFPRQVKDLDGLRSIFGKKDLTLLTQMENEYAKKLGLNSARDLSLGERGYVTNQYIRGYGLTDGAVPRFAKKRNVNIADLTDAQIAKFYEKPEDALALYIRGSVDKIEKYKFFGRNAIKNKDGVFNIDSSIGALMAREKGAGRLDPLDEDELVDLLQARFISGDKPMRKGFGILRDLGYMGTIGNPYASITQIGDLGTAGALHGFRNTIAAMFGTKQIKLIDIGIQNASQEFAEGNIRGTAKALNKIFDWTGFRRFDQFGKESTMNAAFRKALNLVKSEKGEATFRKKWADLYSFEPKLLDDLVRDLKTGKITDNVKFHAFNELSDVQPITLSEMPKAYLNNPNGRLLYMLKSFTLKQIDVVRRNVVQQWKKGNKAEAIKNATALAAYLSTLNLGTKVVKDLLKGRDIDVDQFPKQAFWALAGVYGMNKYSTTKLASGKFDEFLAELVTPAANMITSTAGAIGETFSPSSRRGRDYEKFTKDVPVIGPIYHNWFGGGAEKYNRKLRRERRKVL